MGSFIAYAIFGILTTVVNIVSYQVSYSILALPNVPSTILAWTLAVIFAFITNKLWVFDSPSFDQRTLRHEISTFLGARVSTGILDVLIMYVAVDIMAWPSLFWKCVSNIIVIVLNYVASKLIIFTNKTEGKTHKAMKSIYKKLPCRDIITAILQDLALFPDVLFYPAYQVFPDLQQHGQIMFLSSCDDPEERRIYNALPLEDKSKYATKSPRIHFPDITVEELIKLLQSDEGTIYEDTRATALNVEMKSACSPEVRCLLFIFLHEVGHWYQLREDYGWRIKEFADADLELEKGLFERQQKIQRELYNRKPTAQEKKMLKQLQEEYRQIPKESYANSFAKEKMGEIKAEVLKQFL